MKPETKHPLISLRSLLIFFSCIKIVGDGREANEEYANHMHGVVEKLFKSLSLGLGLEGHELKEAASGDDLVYLLKINYYPPCPRPELALGVPAHTDMSAFTILVPNHVQGLQAFRDAHWYDVKYIPNALVIHIGDQLEVIIQFPIQIQPIKNKKMCRFCV